MSDDGLKRNPPPGRPGGPGTCVRRPGGFRFFRVFPALFPCIIGLSLVAGCYTVGVVPPEGVSRITVPFFKNETFPLERDLEYDLTREVRKRLEEQTDCILVSSEADADAVLEGKLLSFREVVAAEDQLDRPVRSYAFASVSVTFRRAGSGGEIFFTDTWEEKTAFMTDSGRSSAREALVRRIADRIIAEAITTWETE